MSRSKIIKKLKNKNPELNKTELEMILDTFSKSISEALNKGKTVEIRGFGRWYGKKLNENFNTRNPSTNELLYKPERVKVRFKPSKKLKKIINE